jgi:hypothetical protein
MTMSPCMNGGECSDMPRNKYLCECPSGYYGRQCEQVDYCSTSANQCGPNGKCINLDSDSQVVTHYCSCFDQKTFGLSCDTDQTESNPCTNGAVMLYATKMDKSLFIHCEGSLLYIKSCKSPLVYNDNKEECDWPMDNQLTANSNQNTIPTINKVQQNKVIRPMKSSFNGKC